MPRAALVHRTHKKRNKTAQAKARQSQRYYATNSRQWRAIRSAHLSAHPLCVHCVEVGRVVAATVVDHIDGSSSQLNDYRSANLQSLCASHHSKKTVSQDGGFGNARG